MKDKEGTNRLKYFKIIGSFNYLVNTARPGIYYAFGRLARHTYKPNKSHQSALQQLTRYVKGTMEYGLHYTSFPIVLKGFIDAHWIPNSDKNKATSG